MNSEERHELEQNELVKALAHMKSVNRRKIALWVGLALLVFVGIFFLRYMNHLTAGNDADRWVRVQSANDKETLKNLMDLYRGKEPGFVAKMKYARILLTSDGLLQLPTTVAADRLAAANSLAEARKLFLELASEAKNDQMLVQESYINAAKAEETLIGIPKSETQKETSRGDFDQAIKYLESAAKISPESEAGQRITREIEEKRTKKDEIVAFYKELQNSLYVAPILDKPMIKDGTRISGTPTGPELKAPDAPKPVATTPKIEDKPGELKVPAAPKKEEELKIPEVPKKVEEKKAEEKKVEGKKEPEKK